MPVTNPHDTFSWTCEQHDPPITLNASSQKELDRKIDDHNQQYHPA